MICQKCGNYFPMSIIIEGKYRNLCSRKFCLECSPFGIHNTRNINKEIKGFKKCIGCGETKPLNEFYRKSTKRHENDRQSYCMDCANSANINRFKNNKIKAVAYKGGKCAFCGYDKCVEALDFHHVNPEEKDIDFRRIRGWGDEKRNKELDKCILLCSNCHRELHAKLNGNNAPLT